MFELHEQSAKVAHVNLREEKHGDEDVLACDLRIETSMANAFLAQLHPDLLSSLYGRDGQLDLGDNHLSKLRYPKLAPLQWDGQITGGKITLHAPVSDDDLVIFADVDKLKLAPQDGGTVIVTFRAQFCPDGDQAGRIPFLLGKMVEISVEKPAAAAADDLVGDGEDESEDDGDGDDADPK